MEQTFFSRFWDGKHHDQEATCQTIGDYKTSLTVGGLVLGSVCWITILQFFASGLEVNSGVDLSLLHYQTFKSMF